MPKTLPTLRKKLVREFNRYIRLRDKRKGCISCIKGGVDHAGHYFSTSQCPEPSMRFNERNVNGQCINCNSFKEGNRQGYRMGLIRRYGLGIIGDLDVERTLARGKKWTRFEYEAMVKNYKDRADVLEGKQ